MAELKTQETKVTVVSPSDVQKDYSLRKYEVNVSFISSTLITVYARSEEDAMDKASEKADDADFTIGDFETYIQDIGKEDIEEVMDYVTSDETGTSSFWSHHANIIEENFDGQDWNWEEAITYWDNSDIEEAIKLYKEQE